MPKIPAFIEVKLTLDMQKDNDPINGEQIAALVDIAYRFRADTVKAGNGGAGLSSSYIGFTLYESERHIISGGIDKEGAVST